MGMNILYVGAFSTQTLLKQYPDKGLDTYKTSEFFIRGFRGLKDVNLSVVTAPDLGSYPRFPKILIPRIEEDGIKSVGLWNISGIKQLMIIHRLYREACRVINANEGKTYVIIPYMVAHYVRIARKLKQRYGNRVIICQIIPDIFFPKKKLFSLRYWANKYAEKMAADSDCFVLFTMAMANYLGLDEMRCMVMESLIDDKTYNYAQESSVKRNVVTQVAYTGALGKPNGVAKLISMMQKMKRNDFELLITGRGALAEQFEKEATRDKRIRFMGTVPKEDVFKYQSSADVLINPRSDNDAPTVTKYMFPSKLMEYMLTGNAVLTCKMSGIPEDYYNFVYVADDDTPEGLADALNKVLDLSAEEKNEKGQKARNYILTNKTIPVQTRKIVDFLKKF